MEESDSIKNDEGLFRRLNTLSCDSASFTLVITVSSHVPFEGADLVDFPLKDDMPEKIGRYLQSLHYFDIQLGTFLQRLKDEPELRNMDIVITGDHSIMFDQDAANLREYLAKHNLDQSLIKDYQGIPFIVYSPTFTESVVNMEETYQIDIYPTILDVIGCDSIEWRGVGKSMLREEKRRIPVEDATVISDYLIRTNFFSNH